MSAHDNRPAPDRPSHRWRLPWGASRVLIELGIAAFFVGLAVWLIVTIVRFFLGVGDTMDKLGP
jgi:hypothetical protein